ncbi:MULTISPECIES: type I pantothenate kinase [Streptococcus]|jgi:type I pantothenate kinase|uniref:type I pantothenate kinase n=1 Tax=Streptococcus TaxID=1301 RepID=UPI0005002DC5|nr:MULTISPECIES: type I pantothenate kinase [Streptococcus]KFN85478.1 pantothenate kinase [Streptococcus equinus ATCC 33317]MBE6162153.1 type I pantothenate kinase [Streptococcus equinus]MCR5493171.1 type I pantothenate kinase [Streptococcus sp.]MDO4885698.1 type I pantothenate kinase [Streptococcus sp.]QGX46983.1 type I pantothenate kinase [Streptococcus equinus]
MTNEFINFDLISRENWKEFHQQTQPPLTAEELESIKSLNDNISIQDVIEVYLPLISLIQIYKNSQENLSFSKGIFLKKEASKRPFIIGISGSVAVGKSTTSRLLQLLLARTFKDSKVEMVTTDGFIYPNEVLIEKNILDRKGFPESYNMELLLNFLDTVKNGMTAHIPVYSHEVYDIIPDQKQTIEAPDFLIVEGINVFQNQKNKRIYMTGYFDFSIYIDAENELIERWYLERFDSLLELAKTDKTNYYNRFVKMPHNDAIEFAKMVWKTVNLVNLEKYIEPTRNRAELILHKTNNHRIDQIYLKK